MKMLQSFTTIFYPFLQIADLQQEHQREMEGLLENVRQLSRELKLQMLIIDNFIPPEYQVCWILIALFAIACLPGPVARSDVLQTGI